MKAIDLVKEVSDPFKSKVFKGIDKSAKYSIDAPHKRIDLVLNELNDMIISLYASRLIDTVYGDIYTISESDKVAISNSGASE